MKYRTHDTNYAKAYREVREGGGEVVIVIVSSMGIVAIAVAVGMVTGLKQVNSNSRG